MFNIKKLLSILIIIFMISSCDEESHALDPIKNDYLNKSNNLKQSTLDLATSTMFDSLVIWHNLMVDDAYFPITYDSTRLHDVLSYRDSIYDVSVNPIFNNWTSHIIDYSYIPINQIDIQNFVSNNEDYFYDFLVTKDQVKSLALSKIASEGLPSFYNDYVNSLTNIVYAGVDVPNKVDSLYSAIILEPGVQQWDEYALKGVTEFCKSSYQHWEFDKDVEIRDDFPDVEPDIAPWVIIDALTAVADLADDIAESIDAGSNKITKCDLIEAGIKAAVASALGALGQKAIQAIRVEKKIIINAVA